MLETDVFGDLRPVAGSLDTAVATEVLFERVGLDAPAARAGRVRNVLPPAARLWARIRGDEIDLKRAGLTPLVLMARLYGLRVRSPAVGTTDRLVAAGDAGLLGTRLTGDLCAAFDLFTALRLQRQLEQADAGATLTDKLPLAELSQDRLHELRDALKAVKTAQDTTAWTFRTDL